MSKLDGKPEVAIVQTIEQEQKSFKTFEQIFMDLKLKSIEEKRRLIGNSDLKLSLKGRFDLLFPLLEKHAITSWEVLDKEAELIDEKKSNRSAIVRKAIIELHTLCLINKTVEDEKINSQS